MLCPTRTVCAILEKEWVGNIPLIFSYIASNLLGITEIDIIVVHCEIFRLSQNFADFILISWLGAKLAGLE